jgi:hypothetical protein
VSRRLLLSWIPGIKDSIEHPPRMGDRSRLGRENVFPAVGIQQKRTRRWGLLCR